MKLLLFVCCKINAALEEKKSWRVVKSEKYPVMLKSVAGFDTALNGAKYIMLETNLDTPSMHDLYINCLKFTPSLLKPVTFMFNPLLSRIFFYDKAYLHTVIHNER